MPCGDRTGPMGMGPMTGRAAGLCAGFGASGYPAPRPGWGRDRRRGWRVGMGPVFKVPFRYCCPPVPAPEPEREAEFLKEQAEYLEEELKAIKEQLAGLEQEKKE